jgi:hypothetical protein
MYSSEFETVGNFCMKSFWAIFFSFTGAGMLAAQVIPQDAATNCQVAQATFNAWFQSGKPSLNGLVTPANSVGFSTSSVCDFYAWAKQMFLWVTSPVGKAHVFDSAVFYDISPPDSNEQRTFLPHTGAYVHTMAPRAAKKGPHGLPVVQDKSGQLYEVIKPSASYSGKRVILNSAGNLTEVSKVSITANRKLAFQDKSGKMIVPLFASDTKTESLPTGAIRTAHEFLVNGSPVLVDSNNQIIDVEQGQAGTSGVLATQGKDLLYYLTMTNDVYAYFLTAVKNGAISAVQFPTTSTDFAAIQTYAAAHGKPTFTDAQALTMELKSSWVEMTSVTNGNYITTTATIPTYDKSDPNNWVLNGQKKATLGLVGLHIAGSVAGHPEMIWATFEHFGNTPNAAYSYVNTMGNTTNVPLSTAGAWLFTASNSTGPFNQLHMTAVGTSIVAQPKFTISPSDTQRNYAWGAGALNAAANTNLISIQNSVNAMMPQGDIRSKYFLVGATWTTDGHAPPAGQAGATNVANSTMETYTQFPGGCFRCHATPKSPSLAPDVISHIFGGENSGLKPLFPPPTK